MKRQKSIFGFNHINPNLTNYELSELHTYIHTLFATPQRGFSVTKGIKKIKIRQLKWVNKMGKESKINYSIKNLKIYKV
jgi:hypothetical protein